MLLLVFLGRRSLIKLSTSHTFNMRDLYILESIRFPLQPLGTNYNSDSAEAVCVDLWRHFRDVSVLTSPGYWLLFSNPRIPWEDGSLEIGSYRGKARC